MKNIIKRIAKFVLARFIELHAHARIGKRVNLNLKTELQGNNVIHDDSNIANSNIGFGTYIGPSCQLFNTMIGKYCSIAGSVSIAAGNHPITRFVSTHPAFFSILKQAGFSYVQENKFQELTFVDEEERYHVSIGNDVWIATNVILVSGCKVGDGAVIAAGAVVVKDIEPYSIVGGVPAKKIGQRFSDEVIERLMKYKWWDKDEEWIKENADSFSDIGEFFKVIGI